jgi:hypothetical protein
MAWGTQDGATIIEATMMTTVTKCAAIMSSMADFYLAEIKFKTAVFVSGSVLPISMRLCLT